MSKTVWLTLSISTERTVSVDVDYESKRASFPIDFASENVSDLKLFVPLLEALGHAAKVIYNPRDELKGKKHLTRDSSEIVIYVAHEAQIKRRKVVRLYKDGIEKGWAILGGQCLGETSRCVLALLGYDVQLKYRWESRIKESLVDGYRVIPLTSSEAVNEAFAEATEGNPVEMRNWEIQLAFQNAARFFSIVSPRKRQLLHITWHVARRSQAWSFCTSSLPPVPKLSRRYCAVAEKIVATYRELDPSPQLIDSTFD